MIEIGEGRHDGIRVVYWARLRLAREFITQEFRTTPGLVSVVVETLDELVAAIPHAHAVILPDPSISQAPRVAAALRHAPRLTWLHLLTAGQEGLGRQDLPTSIVVTRPGLGISSTVAEHAVGLLLGLLRRLPEHAEMTRDRRWLPEIGIRMRSLEDLTIGIVGFGTIGREVARRLRPFGPRLVVITRSGESQEGLVGARLAELETEAPALDALIVALPLTVETEGRIGSDTLSRLRRGAYLVNVSRGAIVDQQALIELLDSGQLAGAALDVTDPEPLPPDDPLWTAQNILITPHIAGAGSILGARRIAEDVRLGLRRLMENAQVRS